MPDLARLPAHVRDQVQERFRAVGELKARGASGEDLGRAYGALGLMLMAADYSDAGLASLEHAQHLMPSDMRWPYYVGQFHRDRGEREQAVVFLERARTLKPSDPPTLVSLGEAYLDLGRTADAQRVFGDASTRHAPSAAVLAGLGRTAIAQGEAARAVEHLERALALQPDANSLHYPLAIAYRTLGDLQRAELHLQQRGTGQPTLADPLMDEYRGLLESGLALQNRGMQKLQSGRFAEAAALFRRGLVLEPDNAALRHSLGTALHGLGDVDGAIAEFERLVRESPGYAKAHFSLGLILVSQKRFTEALARFTSAVEHDPDDTEARLSLAAGLQMTGRPAASLPH